MIRNDSVYRKKTKLALQGRHCTIEKGSCMCTCAVWTLYPLVTFAGINWNGEERIVEKRTTETRREEVRGVREERRRKERRREERLCHVPVPGNMASGLN